MQFLSLSHLFSQLAALICTTVITGIFSSFLSLCMQQPVFQKTRLARVLLGITTSAALLIASPLVVYRRPRQHMAIGLATMTYMAALTMLDWCLLQAEVPSVRALLSSVVWQPMSGIISSHNAKQKALQARSAPASSQQAAPISAESASSKAAPEQQHTASQLLLETVSALVRLFMLMDIVSAVLQCSFSYGDLPQLLVDPACSSLAMRIASLALIYLFKGVAGFLLGMQLAASYMMGRIVLLLFGYRDLGPVNIFDKPWMASSISDLWSNRWHQVLRYYFTGLGYSLADGLSGMLVRFISGFGFARSASGAQHGNHSSSSSSSSMRQKGGPPAAARDDTPKQHPVVQLGWQREIKKMVRTLVVFAMSGVVHEYVVWAAFGAITGKHLAFFMLHGFAVLAEGLGAKLVKNVGCFGAIQVPMWLRRAWVVGFALVTCPLFVDVLLEHRHYQDYVPPFIVPVTTVALEQLGLCKCA